MKYSLIFLTLFSTAVYAKTRDVSSLDVIFILLAFYSVIWLPLFLAYGWGSDSLMGLAGFVGLVAGIPVFIQIYFDSNYGFIITGLVAAAVIFDNLFGHYFRNRK